MFLFLLLLVSQSFSICVGSDCFNLCSQDSTLVEGDEAGLEEILDQLLEEGAGGGRTQQHRDSVAATVTYVIDHDPPMDTDDTLHDSRMVTHSESQVSCVGSFKKEKFPYVSYVLEYIFIYPVTFSHTHTVHENRTELMYRLVPISTNVYWRDIV